MMAGPDIQPKGYIGNQTVITDLAPTILHLLGCPIPDTMDGKVVAQWLLGDQQVQLASAGEMAVSDNLEFDGTTEEDEEKLIQRLKDLGYLE